MPLLDSKMPEINSRNLVNGTRFSESERMFLTFLDPFCLHCREKLSGMEELAEKELEPVALHVPEFSATDDPERIDELLDTDIQVLHDRDGSIERELGGSLAPEHLLVEDGRLKWHSRMEEDHELEDRLGNPGFRNLYLGMEKGAARNIGNLGQDSYSIPGELRRGRVYLEGEWELGPERVKAGKDAAMELYDRFSRAGLASRGSADVTVDGEKIRHREAGKHLDVRDTSSIEGRGLGLHEMVEGNERPRQLRIEPEKGAEIYSISLTREK